MRLRNHRLLCPETATCALTSKSFDTITIALVFHHQKQHVEEVSTVFERRPHFPREAHLPRSHPTGFPPPSTQTT